MVIDSGLFSRHFIFAMLLLSESLCDLKWRECPDVFHLLMLSLAFWNPEKPFSAVLLLESLPPGGIFLITALFNPGKLGGADVKLAACAGLFLGWQNALLGLSLGLIIALANENSRAKNEGFPLIPYLSIGLSMISIGKVLI